MYSPRFLLLLLSLLVTFATNAQKTDDFKQYRVLILLDGSSSMLESWGEGKTRFREAGQVITRLIDSIYQVNKDVEFGLRVYGHQHGAAEKNCFDTRREVMFSKDNLTQMSLRLEALTPAGVSPIAYSLQTAAETDFADDRNYAYSLILVTDGGESCGGDICDVVKSLLDKKIQFRPYVVSLVDYAPLREQYACLGTYLLASKPPEVAKAIGTITENYRKVFRIPVAKPKVIQTSKIPTPSVLKIDVPAVAIKKETEATAKPQPVPPVKKDTVKATPPVVKPQAATPPPVSSRIVVDEFHLKRDKIAALSPRLEKKTYPLFWSTPTPPKQKIPAIALPKKEPGQQIVQTPVVPPIVEKPKPAAPKPATPKPVASRPAAPAPAESKKKEAVFTAQREPAPETSLEIYFTDGKGKFYQSTPPMELIDVKTGKQVKKFFRTVDAGGNPDPQKIPAGVFTLVIGKDGNYVAKNVTVLEGNKNKLTVVTSKGTLSFAYETNLKRPVTEFTALVKKNFEVGPVMTQKCNTELDFEPGNYHIEINTLPPSRRNIDLDFGSSYRIDIEEPGFVKFTDETPIGKVSLYYQLGDQFMRFYVMDITGNVATQQIRLQPGMYEVHYKKTQYAPNDIVKSFIVKSNETTVLEIQQ